MKRKYKKMKFGILLYFMLFTAIIISLVWIFQMLFLEGFYQNAKTESMKKIGSSLSSCESVDSVEFSEKVTESAEQGISVYVFRNSDLIYPSDAEIGKNCSDAIEKAVNAFKISEKNAYFEINSVYGKDAECSFVYVTKLNGDFLVLTSSRENIVETLNIVRLQLLTITVLVVLIGIIISWYLSVKISKPIDEMSKTAAKWASGDNTVSFVTGSRYAELNEFADTLNFAKEEISKSERLLRDLLANVSHDLKTPLTMIKAYAEMIKDISGNNKEKRERHTQVIIDEADRLTMLVNDILDLSKLQSDVDALELSEINLSDLTEKVIARFSPFVENDGYKIENHVAPDLITYADENKIERVLYNLIGNSVNYTGEDKTVKVFLTADNDKILLEIIDTGKGISEENINSIWERYYRFSETNTRPVKGTGLGLSIVKTILDAHKLRFGVRSKMDFGSNFYVEFDRVKNE
ncbi:MAG TPA: hypothetical protein DDW54_00780 [Clostridiales bacterium]|nr:hypothetical protein [Clostridiales bacterium]